MGNTARREAGQEQHLKALEYANRVRLARARMKRNIAEGELSAAAVVTGCPWQAHSMSISDLLMSQKRWGRTRCRRLAGVPGSSREQAGGNAHRAPAHRARGGAAAKNAPATAEAREAHAGAMPEHALSAA